MKTAIEILTEKIKEELNAHKQEKELAIADKDQDRAENSRVIDYHRREIMYREKFLRDIKKAVQQETNEYLDKLFADS